MRFVFFTHSLVSDWSHDNAHFLRGVASELLALGHEVAVYEPVGGWSRRNLLRDRGIEALEDFERAYPMLWSRPYLHTSIDLDRALDRADVVVVHEWNEPELIAMLGRHRARRGRYVLLFHDTHHRSATAPARLDGLELGAYDGVLVFGEAVRERYLARGWSTRVWTWHQAADTRVFHPVPEIPRTADVVWIGNWGGEERWAELLDRVVRPLGSLGVRATFHGARYPIPAIAALREHGIAYADWLPNYEVPRAFARHRATIHVPRTQVLALPGVPTMRAFEALACGIPLVSTPWSDAEGLFRPGRDFTIASADRMEASLREILCDPARAQEQAASGLETILRRHTCRHRVDELLGIVARVRGTDFHATDPHPLEAAK